jgi:hypothetical protein
MQTLPLDTKKLDFLMDTNPLAADIFEQLNKRKRYSKITDLRRLRMGKCYKRPRGRKRWGFY